MAQIVCSGATLNCSFGMAPSQLSVIPANRVNAGGMPAATILDNAPMLNIFPFGMCTSQANPQVAAATAAAGGVLTPMPCIPVIPAPWSPGSPTVLIASNPALNNSCQANCTWGGILTISMAGQSTVNIP
jgi:hypothetical protein